MNNVMGILRNNYVCSQIHPLVKKRFKGGIVNSKGSINYSREKYSEKRVYVRGKHCGLPGFGFPRPHKKKKLDCHTRGTECACAQNYCYCARG